MNPESNTIGMEIRSFRKRAGISQMELEIAIGASGGMISRIENGTVNPTKETLLKICIMLAPYLRHQKRVRDMQSVKANVLSRTKRS